MLPSGRCCRSQPACKPAGTARATCHAGHTRLPRGARPARLPSQLRSASEVMETKHLLEDARAFIAEELPRSLSTGQLTRAWYADNLRFEDPVVKLNTFSAYSMTYQIMTAGFKIDVKLHDLSTRGNDKVAARWTARMMPKLTPWRASATLTGQSIFTIDLYTGKIISHTDLWDSIPPQETWQPSLDGVGDLVRQLADTTVQQTPNLGTPQYGVLLRTAEFEIRQYESYLVAETEMPSGTGVTGDEGQEGVKMEMTTPVFTETAPGQAAPSMQFVIEDSSPEQLPTPTKAGVATKKVDQGRITAAARFSGLASDPEVVQQEQQLRKVLERAGYRCKPAYRLAHYNDPFTLPMFRRNEVLIDLEDFSWK